MSFLRRYIIQNIEYRQNLDTKYLRFVAFCEVHDNYIDFVMYNHSKYMQILLTVRRCFYRSMSGKRLSFRRNNGGDCCTYEDVEVDLLKWIT